MDENPTQSGGSPEGQGRASNADTLNLALTGSLPCIDCGYELQGLTVKGNCPECGRPVRVTLMWVVDPQAEAFQQLPYPRRIARGLVGVFLAPTSVFIAVALSFLFVWVTAFMDSYFHAARVESATIVFVFTSAALAAIAPIASTVFLGFMYSTVQAEPTRKRFLLAAQIIATIQGIVVWVSLWLYFAWALGGRDPMNIALIAYAATIAMYLITLRPVVAPLIRRSFLLRTGHVPRQKIGVVAIVFVVAVIGHSIQEMAPHTRAVESLELLGAILSIVAWILATLGLLGLTRDAFLVRHTLLHPPRTLEELTRQRTPNNEPRP